MRNPFFVILIAVVMSSMVRAADETGTNVLSSPAESQTFWTRETLVGDPSGGRGWLESQGFNFAPVYTGEVMGNASGGTSGQGVVYDHSLNLPLTIDLDKFTGWWDGGIVYANALWIAGRSLAADDTGDLSGVSNIAGNDAWRLQELWFQQGFWQTRASLKLGVIAADTEFFTSDSASLYLNGTFGAFTLLGANLPNPPIYPMAAPAVRLRLAPVPEFYFQAGIFDGNTETQDDNLRGTDFRLAESDGALIFSEIGYRLHPAAGEGDLAGAYKLGSFVHTANFHDWNNGTSAGADYGIYGVVDQELYKRDGKSISFFTRAGWSPADINTIDWYLDGGFNFRGFIPHRPDDIFGLAVAHSSFSRDFSNYQVKVNGTHPFDAETVLEATVRIRLSPWWSLQPDFQYIWTPCGEDGVPDAVVFGLRTTITF
jgi:porin